MVHHVVHHPCFSRTRLLRSPLPACLPCLSHALRCSPSARRLRPAPSLRDEAFEQRLRLAQAQAAVGSLERQATAQATAHAAELCGCGTILPPTGACCTAFATVPPCYRRPTPIAAELCGCGKALLPLALWFHRRANAFPACPRAGRRPTRRRRRRPSWQPGGRRRRRKRRKRLERSGSVCSKRRTESRSWSCRSTPSRPKSSARRRRPNPKRQTSRSRWRSTRRFALSAVSGRSNRRASHASLHLRPAAG